jgi:Concanavalin A-like lectin/glucanases superfamily
MPLLEARPIPVRVRRTLVAALSAAAALSAMASPASAAPKYEKAVMATPGLQHYLRLGDSGPWASDLGPAARSCDLGPSRYGEQVSLGHPGALARGRDTAAGFDGATPDRVWGSSLAVNCGAVPDSGPLDPFTMEAWVRPERLDSNSRRVFAREDSRGGTLVAARADGLVFSRFVKAHDVTVSDPDPALERTIHVPERWTTLKAPVAPGAWTHVVAAYDGVQMSLILDGRLAAQQVTSIPVDASGLRIGANPAGYLEWDGLIDEAATYSTALTVEQAAAHHAAAAKRRRGHGHGHGHDHDHHDHDGHGHGHDHDHDHDDD